MPKGRHGLEFEVVEGWERLPEGWSFTEVAGVAVSAVTVAKGDHESASTDLGPEPGSRRH